MRTSVPTLIREVYGVMAADGAAGGFVVTSGRFTPENMAFAKGCNITLIEDPDLLTLIKRAHAGRISNLTSVESAEALTASMVLNSPSCPLCAEAMLKRVAKRGSTSGGSLWGWIGFPACRGTRQAG